MKEYPIQVSWQLSRPDSNVPGCVLPVVSHKAQPLHFTMEQLSIKTKTF